MHRILRWAMSVFTPLLSRAAESTSREALITRVNVLLSGKILLDGRAVTVSEVRRALEQVSAERGTVWFYRESGKGAPPPEAIAVFKLIVENRIPVSLSSKADFSDYVDENGQSHPRK